MESASSALKNMMRVTLARYGAVDLRERSVFLKNLTFLYYVMVASEHLLKCGMAMTAADTPLHQFYKLKREEETGHADWLAEDLAEAGVGRVKIPQRAIEMAGSQYYLMFHIDPCALLGYIAVLEGHPMGKNDLSILQDLHGEKLCRTLAYHAEHDVQHREDLFAFIDTLEPDQHLTIIENAIQTCHYFGRAFASFRSKLTTPESLYDSTY